MTRASGPTPHLPSSAAATSQDVKVPPLPPDQLAARLALKRRAAHAVMVTAMVFFGGLSLVPSYVVPRAPMLWSFGGSMLVVIALCGPAVGALRTGPAAKVAFALGFVPGGVLIALGAAVFASMLASVGDALGLQVLGVAGPIAGLFIVSLAVGVLGLFAHRPMGAGALLSVALLAAGAVFFVMLEGPRASERVSIDGAHELVRYPGGFSAPLELSSSCGAFAIEHTGVSALARRPVLSCETGREWFDPCKAQIRDVVAASDAFRVHLTDGDTVVLAPDGSTFHCESADAVCHLDCRRAGRAELEAVRVEPPPSSSVTGP